MSRPLSAAVVALALFAPLAAQSRLDAGINAGIRDEENNHSQIMRVLHVLTRQALAPFQDLGVGGASATTSRTVGGTDSTSFNNAGLPGIGFSQDPIEYNSHTHHTNLDTYERVIEDDVKASAIEIAATLYQLVMRDEMLPRLPAAQMPPLPAPPRF